jgi:hypothetical protein
MRMDFAQLSIITYSDVRISKWKIEALGELAFPMPLLPNVADLVLSPPFEDEPAGEP